MVSTIRKCLCTEQRSADIFLVTCNTSPTTPEHLSLWIINSQNNTHSYSHCHWCTRHTHRLVARYLAMMRRMKVKAKMRKVLCLQCSAHDGQGWSGLTTALNIVTTSVQWMTSITVDFSRIFYHNFCHRLTCTLDRSVTLHANDPKYKSTTFFLVNTTW